LHASVIVKRFVKSRINPLVPMAGRLPVMCLGTAARIASEWTPAIDW